MNWIDELLAHSPQRRALSNTLKLMRVPTAKRFVPGPRRFWYRGADAYFDVFIDVKDGEVEWCQFTLRGMSMTWNPKTGRLQTDATGEMNLSGSATSASPLLYGLRSSDARRFALLALLMLEQSDQEPLFSDVAKQLRGKMGKPPATDAMRASL